MFSSRPSFLTSKALPLNVNAVLRAITNAPLMRDKSVVRLSVTPSTKYSCSGSPPMFTNGSTTRAKCGAEEWVGCRAAALCHRANAISDCGIDPDRAGNVFEVLLAQIGELNPDLASDLVVGRRRDADAPGF